MCQVIRIAFPFAAMLIGVSLAAARAEEIVLNCQITVRNVKSAENGETYKAHVETDGISLTIRQDDGQSSYYTNEKSESSERFLRVGPSEITFGSKSLLPILDMRISQEMIINRNTGEFVTNRTVDKDSQPRAEVGQCEKAATPSKAF